MSREWQCRECKRSIGIVFSARVHIKGDGLEAILRHGEVTLSCPQCHTLNEIILTGEAQYGRT